MQRTIIPVHVGKSEFEAKQFEVNVPWPAKPVHFGIVMKEAPLVAGGIIHSGNPMQQLNGHKMMEVIPTILFEVDPGGSNVKKKFVILQEGQIVQSDKVVEFRGIWMLPPQGFPLFVFEEFTTGETDGIQEGTP